MNAPRKKSAVNKHFGISYQSLDELKAGLQADESGYTENEIAEIIEAIGQKAKDASKPNGEPAGTAPVVLTLPNLPESLNPEDLAEFNAWKASKNGLHAGSTNDLVKAVTAAAPKVNRYKDFDVFQGKMMKRTKSNPFNPTQPNVINIEIKLGERKRLSRIEPALAYEFNEYATGQETGMNHGDASTAEYYFPAGKYTTGATIPYPEFAAFQRQDIRYAEKYHPHNDISLLVAAGYGSAIN